MTLTFSTLKLDQITDFILRVTLNRPEYRNAINSQMMLDLRDLWTHVYAEQEQLRCIILTGSEKAFCAGADLKERKDLNTPVWLNQHAKLQQAMRAMLDCPVPIIAAVNGAAFGGGLELTLASDFAYAADTAIFAQSEVKLGIMPGAMGTQNLPRAAGLRRAKELTFSAQSFSAQQALEWGIINKICSSDTLNDEVLAVARKISENGPLAVREAKKALNFSQCTDPKAGFAFEIEAYSRLIPTKDRYEGISAFNEKRKPAFKGE